MTYGSREWLEAQYARSPDDPWGLDWRPCQRIRYQRMLAALAGVAAGRPFDSIVDIGCATGSFTSLLAGLGTQGAASVTGADIAQSAVDRARLRHPAISFERLDFADCARRWPGSVDLVTCLEVLYYLPDAGRDAALANMKSMLRPRGLLMVSSMIAGAPYLDQAQLTALVGRHLQVVDAGVLPLKQVNAVERLWLRASRLLGNGGGPRLSATALTRLAGGAERLAALFERLLGDASHSHGYLVARRTD